MAAAIDLSASRDRLVLIAAVRRHVAGDAHMICGTTCDKACGTG